MTVTPFGEFLRRERRDRNLLLGGLAKLLKISTPYLSQLETGQRFVPDGFEDKVIKILNLEGNDANEIRRAAAVSRAQYSLSVNKDATADDRALAHDLAESFARLSPEGKEKLRKLLEEDRHD
jgi:HTH-type transcriptional regulator, competence development regulator